MTLGENPAFLLQSMEQHTCYTEYAPPAPPPSPTKLTSLPCAKSNKACPSTLCALHLVDRKIEAHQSKLSPIQHTKPSCPYTSALWGDNVCETKLKYHDEGMHRKDPLRQISSASDDDNMPVTSLRCYSPRSSGTNTLVNYPLSEKEVDFHSTAIGLDCQRKTATSPHSGTQHSSPRSPSFCLFNLRSCREAIADAPNGYRFPSSSINASRWRPTVTSRHISSPTPVSSSAIPDISSFSLLHTHNKTQSWPGPCSQLPIADTASIPKATARSKSRKRGFACICRRKHTTRGEDGRLPSCARCLRGNEIYPSNEHSLNLQPLAEHARGEEAVDEEQAATVEEERSHFSDSSTDEEDNGEKVPSNARLFNSLGRLKYRSRTRLSWGNLFSKP